jgi:hypothetical protein
MIERKGNAMHPIHPHHPLAALLALAVGLILGLYLLAASASGLPIGIAWAFAPALTLFLLTLRARAETAAVLVTLTALYALAWFETQDQALRGLEPALAILLQFSALSFLLLYGHIRREMRSYQRRR